MTHTCFKMPVYSKIQTNDNSTYLIGNSLINRSSKLYQSNIRVFDGEFKWNYCPYCKMKLEDKK